MRLWSVCAGGTLCEDVQALLAGGGGLSSLPCAVGTWAVCPLVRTGTGWRSWAARGCPDDVGPLAWVAGSGREETQVDMEGCGFEFLHFFCFCYRPVFGLVSREGPFQLPATCWLPASALRGRPGWERCWAPWCPSHRVTDHGKHCGVESTCSHLPVLTETFPVPCT